MGYLTFVDVIMAITFAVNTLVVIYNVYLKWLEIHNRTEKADRIDRFADWVYPLGYLVLFGSTILYFFR
jgi:heme/copper-type cytochrome/quinol oxidase subunit 1